MTASLPPTTKEPEPEAEPENPRKALCIKCGAASRDEDRCDACGEDFSDSDNLGITLVVQQYTCDQCGHVGAALTCPECGLVEPEPSRLAFARQKAFGPFLEDLRGVLASFDDIGEPHLPVSLIQFNAAVIDACPYDYASEVISFFRDRGGFVLDTGQDIGQRMRPVLRDFVRHCEELRARIAEIAWCEPPTDYSAARTAMIDMGRQVLTLAVRIVEMLVVADGDEAREHQPRLQAALDCFDFKAYLDPLNAFRESGEVDDSENDVLCRLFGVDGQFIDESGELSLPTLLQALDVKDEGVLVAAPKAVGKVLGSLPNDVLNEAPIMSLMVGQIASVATSASPARSHRIMTYFWRALEAAWTKDSGATTAALQKVIADSRRMISAQVRLARRAAVGEATEEVFTRFEILADMYRIAAEGTFRSYAVLANELSAISTGRTMTEEVQTLGQLVPAFRRHPDELARLLTDAVDIDLRNALAHEAYEIRVEDERVVIDLLDEERLIDIDDLERMIVRLSGATSGLDLAVSAFMSSRGVFDEVADEFAADHPAFNFLAAQMFAAAGVTLQSVDRIDEGFGFIVGVVSQPHRLALLTPLVALSHHVGDAEEFVVIDTDQELLVRTTVAEVRANSLVAEDDVAKQVRLVGLSASCLASTHGIAVLDSVETVSLASHMCTVLIAGYMADENAEGRLLRTRKSAQLAWSYLARLGDTSSLPKPFSSAFARLLKAPSKTMIEQALIDLEKWREWQVGGVLDHPLIESGSARRRDGEPTGETQLENG